jgi:hypothetical protein
MSSPSKIKKFYYERATPKNPRPVLEPDLVPGESILDISVHPGLATPTGWDTYWMGNAEQLDLNSTPACLGNPSKRKGFYNIEDGTTGVVCPFCGQGFTTLDLEGRHMWGPCQRFRERVVKNMKIEEGKKGMRVSGGKEGFLVILVELEHLVLRRAIVLRGLKSRGYLVVPRGME